MSLRDVVAPKTLESLVSFKVSASVSEAATSRSRLGQNFERFGLGSEGLVHISAVVACLFDIAGFCAQNVFFLVVDGIGLNTVC